MPLLDKIPENSSGLFMTLNFPYTGYSYTIGLVTETPRENDSSNISSNNLSYLEVIPTVVLSIETQAEAEPSVLNVSDSSVPFLEDINYALENGVQPQPCSEGVCGTYFLLSSTGKRRGVFKPCDEEPGAINYTKEGGDSAQRIGITPGEAAVREVAAFELDNGFASVPQTHLIEFDDSNNFFNSEEVKVGSLQEYVDHECSSEDVGSSLFSIDDVQRIAVMDIRLINLDRHAGNILVGKNNRLIPIDHGFCLPECFEDPLWFEWMNWSQSKQPILPEIKDYIESLNCDSDCAVLESFGLSVAARRSLRVGTYLLKAAVQHDLSLSKIASLLCTYGDKFSEIKHLFDKHSTILSESINDCLPEVVIEDLNELVISLKP